MEAPINVWMATSGVTDMDCVVKEGKKFVVVILMVSWLGKVGLGWNGMGWDVGDG